MNIRTDTKIKLSMGVSISVIAVGVAILAFWTPSRAQFFFSMGLIVAGMLIFTILLHATTKPETELVADERIARINERAGNSAYWMVLISMTILFGSDRAWSIGIEIADMYYAAMFVGIISRNLLRWYYNRKGDVIQ